MVAEGFLPLIDPTLFFLERRDLKRDFFCFFLFSEYFHIGVSGTSKKSSVFKVVHISYTTCAIFFSSGNTKITMFFVLYLTLGGGVGFIFSYTCEAFWGTPFFLLQNGYPLFMLFVFTLHTKMYSANSKTDRLRFFLNEFFGSFIPL